MDQSNMGPGGHYAQGASNEASHSRQQYNSTSRFNEELDGSVRDSILPDADAAHQLKRSNSGISQSQSHAPARGGTLKKRQSLKRGNSLRRSSSRRSIGAGSVKSLALGDREKYEGSDFYSAFYTPVPTKGNPTEILANRFQDWRRVLKDLIAYFREVQKSHEQRSKSLLGLSNIASNISHPPTFTVERGICDATKILKEYHRQALAESNKAKAIEDDIMGQLNGLRSDLSQKIKEIKNLSGDFKNSVDKETETTRKAVRSLQEAVGLVDTDPGATSGKGDPYIIKLGVERQIEKQIDEENYLHKAFLNLEHSGRELESIVVGEIQKAYNAYAGILKREADEAYEAVESLRTGPVVMAKDAEWEMFVNNNEHFVDPRMPLRKPEHIVYPGKDAPAAAEVRCGMLERKSKYLKSYTPGWYVLSPTHLHEFKSADRVSSQTPVMSLYLQDQKLGSHSGPDSSSHKFMLKGRQAGGIHRGHGWVFRAESRDTMLAWYEDIKNLTEKTGLDRDTYVRRHTRSVSAGSHTAGSVSSDGAMDEDEADQVPYSATPSQFEAMSPMPEKSRPQPGGRFPSDLNVNRNLQMPLSPSSGTSSDRDIIAAAAIHQGSTAPATESEARQQARTDSEDYITGPYSRGHENAFEQEASQKQDSLNNKTPAPTMITPPLINEPEQPGISPRETRVPTETKQIVSSNSAPEPTVFADGNLAGEISEQRDARKPSPHQDTGITNQDHLATIPLTSEPPSNAQALESTSALQRTTANTIPDTAPATAGDTLSPGKLASSSTPAPPTTITAVPTDSAPSTDITKSGRVPLPHRASEQTVSDLHVPGEFPRASISGKGEASAASGASPKGMQN